MDPEDPTVIAETELLGAAASIEAAAKKLEQLKPRAKPKVHAHLSTSPHPHRPTHSFVPLIRVRGGGGGTKVGKGDPDFFIFYLLSAKLIRYLDVIKAKFRQTVSAETAGPVS